jgi:hypothetical protein
MIMRKKRTIKSLTYNLTNAADVIDAANRLAQAQNRTAHDVVKILILTAAEGLNQTQTEAGG